MEQTLAGPGRDMGGLSIRVAEAGGNLGALEIVLLVLGLLLWAAVMTALVMAMIVLVRNLREPRPAMGLAAATKSSQDAGTVVEAETAKTAKNRSSKKI